MQNLSEAQRTCLERMARTDGPHLAYPSDNTGKALLRRGLVDFVGRRCCWNYYRITGAGRAALEGEK